MEVVWPAEDISSTRRGGSHRNIDRTIEVRQGLQEQHWNGRRSSMPAEGEGKAAEALVVFTISIKSRGQQPFDLFCPGLDARLYL